MKKVMLVAHRGYRTKYPENTLLAFKEALKLDIDGIETDVRMTNDRHIVIMHDPNLDRTTNAHGHICDRSLEEVKQADAGIKFGECFKGEKVPTLLELIELLKERTDIKLYLELKDYPEEYGLFAYESCELSLKLCKENGIWGQDRLTIITFSSGLVEWLRIRYSKDDFSIHGFYPTSRMKGNSTFLPYLDEVCIGGGEDKFPDQRPCWPKDKPITDKVIFDLYKNLGIKPATYFQWDVDKNHYKTAIEYGSEIITTDDAYTIGLYLDEFGVRKLK